MTLKKLKRFFFRKKIMKLNCIPISANGRETRCFGGRFIHLRITWRLHLRRIDGFSFWLLSCSSGGPNSFCLVFHVYSFCFLLNQAHKPSETKIKRKNNLCCWSAFPSYWLLLWSTGSKCIFTINRRVQTFFYLTLFFKSSLTSTYLSPLIHFMVISISIQVFSVFITLVWITKSVLFIYWFWCLDIYIYILECLRYIYLLIVDCSQEYLAWFQSDHHLHASIRNVYTKDIFIHWIGFTTEKHFRMKGKKGTFSLTTVINSTH